MLALSEHPHWLQPLTVSIWRRPMHFGQGPDWNLLWTEYWCCQGRHMSGDNGRNLVLECYSSTAKRKKALSVLCAMRVRLALTSVVHIEPCHQPQQQQQQQQ